MTTICPDLFNPHHGYSIYICPITSTGILHKLLEDIITKKSEPEYHSHGKIKWYYTGYADKSIRLQHVELRSQVRWGECRVGETVYDSDLREYSCDIFIEKVLNDFSLSMKRQNPSRWIGFANAKFFIKCRDDPKYPPLDIEFNDNHNLYLHIWANKEQFSTTFPGESNDEYLIHISYEVIS
jgi:hypothetical protein